MSTPHWTITHLTNVRRENGVRQHNIADHLDVWPGVVANWEIGHGEPSARHVAAIAEFLGWRLVATGDVRVIADGDLAAELRRLRIEAGVTQVEMASRLGFRQSGVAMLESRCRTVRIGRVEAYLRALGYRLGLVPADAPILRQAAMREAS